LTRIECKNSITNIVFSAKESKLFLIENTDNSAIINTLDEENNLLQKVAEIKSTTGGYLYESSTDSFNVLVNSTLMSFDLEANTFTPIFDVLGNGISGYIRYIFPFGDEYILIHRVSADPDSVTKLAKTTNLLKSNQTLTLATLESNRLIELAVADFNKSNSEYTIEIMDYSVYGENALKMLNTEIIAGKIPDIFDMNGLSVKQYIAMGLLADLDLYMKNDPDMEDVWESAISAMYVNGGCYTIVPGFEIELIFGNKETISELNNLNFTEILNYIKENSNSTKNAFGNHMTQLEFVEFVFSSNMDSFINYETKECYFTGDEFIALLETARGLAPYENNYDEALAIYYGTQPISFQSVRGVSNLDFFAAIYQDDFATTNLSCDTDRSGVLMIPLYTFGMSSQSEFKEAAWDFLKMFYSEELEQYMYQGGIPMSKAYFEAQWDIYKGGIELCEEYNSTVYTYGGVENGEMVTVEIQFSKNRRECYQNTIDLIDSIDRIYEVDTIVMDIISNEFQACLYGDKSAEEVAALIQSRVHIYLNE